MSTSVLVLDNGASTIKACILTGDSLSSTQIVPNAIVRSKGDKKTYFGHEIAECRDFSSLHYRLPFERGFLTDWDAQKAIWDGLFSKDMLGIKPSEMSLLITEPYFNLSNIQTVYDQFIFEEYEFQSYFRTAPASLIPHGELFRPLGALQPECMIIIDSGFSFTHVIPVMNGSIIWKSVRRLDVGGKLLTNQLKELVSFRQWNMMDETYIINDVKESCCYVSSNFRSDLETCHLNSKNNPIVQEYILPDFSTNRRGRVKGLDDIISDKDQILLMNNERFTVPEILFHPTDIGLEQSGLSETIANTIGTLPEDLQGLFWANIGLIGGNTKIPGFRQRLMLELRSLAPADYNVQINESTDAILETQRSAVHFASNSQFTNYVVTKAEYQESGANASRRKFKDWKLSRDVQPEYREKDVELESRDKTRLKGKARARGLDEQTKKSNRGKVKKSAKTSGV